MGASGQAVSSTGDLFPRGKPPSHSTKLSSKKRSLSQNPLQTSPRKRARRQSSTPVVKALSRKVLHEGVLILGIIRWVRGGRFGVGLPGNIRGGGEIDEELFLRVGSFVVCRVIGWDGGSGVVRVSVGGNVGGEVRKAGEVVSGVVKSVEDHGCVVGIGEDGRGFWKFEDGAQEFVEGEVVLGFVKKVRGGVVGISGRGRVVDMGDGFADLKPGLLVRGVVGKVGVGHGVVVKVWDGIFVDVESIHVERGFEKKFKEGDSVLVRIVWVDFADKRAGGSLLERLVDAKWGMKMGEKSVEIGDVLEDLEVVKVDEPDVGVLLQSTKCLVWVSVGRISDDERVTDLATRFPRGKKVGKVKIVGWSEFDGLGIGTMRESQVSQKLWAWQDIKAGSIYECCVVGRSKDGSLKVIIESVGELQGIVPATEILDYAVSQKRLAEDRRFKNGTLLKCRVIAVDSKRKRARLNSQSRIVQSTLPIISSYADASNNVGNVVIGVVVATTEGLGVIVRFCNRVTGYIPGSDLGQVSDRDELDERFPRGMPIQVRIVKANLREQKCTLSVDLKGESTRRLMSHKGRNDHLAEQLQPQIHSLVNGFVSGVHDGNRKEGAEGAESQLALDGSYLTVSILSHHTKAVIANGVDKETKREAGNKSSNTAQHVCQHGTTNSTKVDDDAHSKTNCTDKIPCLICMQCKQCEINTTNCILPAHHLSDDPEMCERLFGIYKSKLDAKDGLSPIPCGPALVLATQKQKGAMPKLSLKRSLIAAVSDGQLPQSASQLQVKGDNGKKRLFRGYIISVETSGCIISFGQYAGYCRKSSVADEYVQDARDHVNVGMSVVCVVEEIQNDGRCLLSMKESDVGDEWKASDLKGVMDQLDWVRNSLSCRSASSQMPVGTVVSAIEARSRPHGTVLRLITESRSKVTGVAIPANASLILEKLKDAKEAAENGKAKMAASREQKGIRLAKVKKSEKAGVSVLVVDVDAFTGVADVVLPISGFPDFYKINAALPEGVLKPGRVILVKSMYVILVVEFRKKSYIVFAPTSKQEKLVPGTQVNCTAWGYSHGRNIVRIVPQRQKSQTEKIFDGHNKQKGVELKKQSGSHKANLKCEIGAKISGIVRRVNPFEASVHVSKGMHGRIHVVNNIQYNKDKSVHDLNFESLPLGVVEALHAKLPNPKAKLSAKILSKEKHGSDTFLELKSMSAVEIPKMKGAQIGVVVSNDTLHGVAVCVDCGTANVVAKVDRIGVKVKVGDVVKVTSTTKATAEKGKVYILSDNGRHSDHSSASFKAQVASCAPGKGIKIFLPSIVGKGRIGWIPVTEVADDFDVVKHAMQELQTGQVLTVRAKDRDNSDNAYFSMRTSYVASEKASSIEVKDPSYGPKSTFIVGQKVRGIVRAVAKSGVFVSLGYKVVARILLSNLANEFVTSPEVSFPVGAVVSGKILKANTDGGKLEMSLRDRSMGKVKTPKLVEKLKEGSIVHGVVERITRYGALLNLDNHPGSALLHLSQVSDDRYVDDSSKEFAIGMSLTCVVISVEENGNKVGLSTKESCFLTTERFSTAEISEILKRNKSKRSAEGRALIDDNIEKLGSEDDSSPEDPENNNTANDLDSDVDVVISNPDSPSDSSDESNDESTVQPLTVEAGFDFGTEQVAASGAGNVDEMKNISPKRTKNEIKAEEMAAEEQIRRKEEKLASNSADPQTPGDFERLLLASPNSSVLWLRYMALHLSLGEVDVARSVAERALARIEYRNEEELFNIWVGYVNLEACYGSHDNFGRHAAVFRVLDRAAHRVTNPKKLYVQTATNLRRREETRSIAEEVTTRSLKMFKSDEEVWIAAGTAFFENNAADDGRKLLERALLCVDRVAHTRLIMKFAQLEYNYGNIERGRTVFEKLVGSSPKKLDLWNIYLDLEINTCKGLAAKSGDGSQGGLSEAVESCRLLFDRCASVQKSSKKTKYVFKKWLKFEQEYGDKESIALVKSKARAYVESKLS